MIEQKLDPALNNRPGRRLFAYSLHFKGLIGFSLLALIVGTLSELVLPLIIKDVIDTQIVSSNGQKGSESALITHGFIYLGLLVVSLVATFVQLISTSTLGQRIMHKLRLELLGHSLTRSLKYLQQNPIGKLVTRLTSDVETVNEFFTSVITSLIRDLALMAGVITLLFLLDPVLAVIALLCALPLLIVSFLFRPWYKKAFRNIRFMVSKMNTFLSEHLSGMHIIQAFVRQKAITKKFDQTNEELKKASLSEMYVFTVFRPLVDLVGTSTIAVLIYFGAGLYHDNLLSLGVLVAFIYYMQKFFEPILDISDKFNILQSAIAGGERVFESLDVKEAIKATGTYKTDTVRGDLEFKDVWFSYREGEPILKGLSFKVEAGKKIAVVGYTGAGKTTITNVMTRLWEIDKGEVSLDGINIAQYDLNCLRSAIVPITQDINMFSDTIRSNLCMGRDYSDEYLWEVLEKAQAKDLVNNLPDKLETVLNEGGTNLSLGERQLLHFARIIALNPQVIIMDEATSSIDSETERRVQNAIDNLTRNKTSLIIAHRLSTIKNADTILVLSGGLVVESGNHQELLKKKGLYAYLYDLQFAHGS